MPTFDAALLCSSRAGSDLGCESGLVRGALSIGFPHSLNIVVALPPKPQRLDKFVLIKVTFFTQVFCKL